MKNFFKHGYWVLGFLVLVSLPLLFVKIAKSQTATNLVISEVQIAGVGTGNSGQDFIEIYNPTSQEINLDGLRLAKRTSTAVATASASIVAFNSDEKVAPYSYFLWCNGSLADALNCDKSTGAIVSNNNTIAILNGALIDGIVLDAVTFGSPDFPFGEGTFLTAPEPGTSVERKAKGTSTAESMMDSLLDGLLGNGYDSGSNASDFIVRDSPQPQNSASASETLAEATPTVTETLTPTPSETATPTPTVTETITPTPSETATPTPTQTESPTPTPSETVTPTPSETIMPTPTVTPIPTSTPVEEVVATFNFPSRNVVCKIIYKPYKVLFLSGVMPTFSCSKVSEPSTSN